MGQMSAVGIQLIVSDADAWSLSAELTVGYLQDDATDTQMLCMIYWSYTHMGVSKSGSSLWITARKTELNSDS